MFRLISFLTALSACVGCAAAAPNFHHVEVSLVSSRAVVAPGARFLVGIREQIAPGWHTYWRNPGDSGIATSINWALPPGFSAGPIEWPAPEAVKSGTLVNYGYEGDVLLPVEIAASAYAATTAPLRAHVSWLECKDVCIPGDADVALDLKVAAHGAADPDWTGPLAAAQAAVPQPARVNARIGRSGKLWRLEISGGPFAAGAVRNAEFFPYAGDAIDYAASEQARVNGAGLAFTLSPAEHSSLGQGPLAGVVTYEANRAGAWTREAVEISAAPGLVSSSAPEPGLGLLAALVFAFAGGLILNLMPCVFPVLSIKALHIARAGHESEARRHGFLFLAGVMTAFLALAGLLIALQSAGAEIGWGFQLQEPLVVAALALLFFVIGLNLLGAFEIGAGAQALGADLAAHGGNAGAFFTGALAVVAATPCTAPFMGAAMGYAATQPPALALAVFAALGLGFALPFFALSVAPPLRDALPRPGAWMETFKQLLAFPMFAAAIWLVWVLDQQKGANAALMALAAFLVTSFIVWALKATAGAARWFATALGALLLLGAAGALVALRGETTSPSALIAAQRDAWSPARLAALRAAGKPVFVDFTAAWCVTCQVNERAALHSSAVQGAFAKRGVTYLVADWTSQDTTIARALKEFGRVGVPLYVYYPPGQGAAKVLPQILTPAIVLSALGAKQA